LSKITEGFRGLPAGKHRGKVRIRRDQHSLFLSRPIEDHVIIGFMNAVAPDMHGVVSGLPEFLGQARG
jgi:hypothetical protein